MTLFLAGVAVGFAAGLWFNRRAVRRRSEIIHWTRQHLDRYETAVDRYEHVNGRLKTVCRRWQHLDANGPRIP